jgi:hypothetical protein
MKAKVDSAFKPPPQPPSSRRNILLLIGGLVLAGVAAGYSWLRGLPKD